MDHYYQYGTEQADSVRHIEPSLVDSFLGMPWLTITLVILTILFIKSTFFTVHGKTAAILETFGRPHAHAKMPGLRFKLPSPITRIVERVNLQLQELKADVSVKTKDNAFVTLPVKVQYRASDDPVGAVKAHYELNHPERQISSYILNNVRQTAAGMKMEDLFENRDQLERQVAEGLSARFQSLGYFIESVLVDQPQPSKEVQDAFNQVIASQRAKEAAENDAEALRVKLVGAARAEKESKKLQGEGMADMRTAIAAGLEESLKIIERAGIAAHEAMAFLMETNRLDTISNAAAHGNMIIVDTRSENKIGETLASVKAVTGPHKPTPVDKAA